MRRTTISDSVPLVHEEYETFDLSAFWFLVFSDSHTIPVAFCTQASSSAVGFVYMMIPILLSYSCSGCLVRWAMLLSCLNRGL
jgi:hypothetical protein